MKICVIGTRGFPNIQGGVEKHCEFLYTSIAKNSPQTEIIVFRRKSYVKKGNENNIDNIKFIDLPSTRIKGLEAVLHSFLATIYSLFIRPDIVHIHNIGPSLFAPLLNLAHIKVVITYHSANYEHKKWGNFAKLILKISEKIAFACANTIIFVNRFQMEKCKSRIKKKCYYIPNGIVSPQKILEKSTLERFNLYEKQYILSVGRITPEKGFDTLIKAYNLSSTNLKLVIVGEAETETDYKKELIQLAGGKNIIFTGTLLGNDLAEIYQNAGFYILASRNEGFPIVLLEAMSYGLDLIVSDIPATHLIPLDKSSYFKLDDIKELSTKIDLKSSKIERKKYNLSEYNWNNIAKKTIEAYTEIYKHN